MFTETPTPVSSTHALKQRFDALRNPQRFGRKLRKAARAVVEERDNTAIRHYGVDPEYAWCEMPTRFLATEEGNLEISAGPLRLSNARDAEGQPCFDPAFLTREEKHYLGAAESFAEQAAVNGRCRLLFEIDDLSHRQHATLTPQLRSRCLQQLTEFLQKKGVLRDPSQLGADVGFLCSSEQRQNLERVVDHVSSVKHGVVQRRGDGSIAWLPGARAIEQAGIRDGDRDECREILLRTHSGEPTREAHEIASYLNPVNRDVTHLHFRAVKDRDHANRVAVALDALGIADMSTQHDVLLDTQRDPALTTAAIRSLIDAEASKKARDLQRFTEPLSKDPHAYNLKNYAEVLDFDVETIREVLRSAAERGVGLHSRNTVHIPAAGAAVHWLALSAMFVKPEQTLIASDYSERNIEKLREYLGWRDDQPPASAPEEIPEPWSQWLSVLRDVTEDVYGEHMTEQEIWEHLVQVCQPVGGPEHGDMLRLEPEHADMTLQFYGNCSFHPDRDMAYKAASVQTQATKRNGVVVVVNFTGAKGWGDGVSGAHLASGNIGVYDPERFAHNSRQTLVESRSLGRGTRPDEQAKVTVGMAAHAQYTGENAFVSAAHPRGERGEPRVSSSVSPRKGAYTPRKSL